MNYSSGFFKFFIRSQYLNIIGLTLEKKFSSMIRERILRKDWGESKPST